ncbi:PREDICTED: soluble starch synthase 3, chloroplastic/amyloplastic-like isoform X5 [Nicotiana attenuata]|uniref:soluble starch synthase 3, chloroplastic/amyloplastic-like isoform X5 n=1 Tax=Nicotiana attenuata TaxID=49451 RepID=UPI000904A0D3|nr:PREDICTED: soluble starch synthase 3, chloroplastic/amyloplastic-like isoform X5 [Nicotiana attenuata]
MDVDSATGGLYDTVCAVDHDKERAQQCGLEPNGFSFDGADAVGVDYALNRIIWVMLLEMVAECQFDLNVNAKNYWIIRMSNIHGTI